MKRLSFIETAVFFKGAVMFLERYQRNGEHSKTRAAQISMRLRAFLKAAHAEMERNRVYNLAEYADSAPSLLERFTPARLTLKAWHHDSFRHPRPKTRTEAEARIDAYYHSAIILAEAAGPFPAELKELKQFAAAAVRVALDELLKSVKRMRK